MPTKMVSTFQQESKLSRNTALDQNESTLSSKWLYFHPNISETFYQKLTPPASFEDACIQLSCHQQSVDDFELQLEMCGIEIDLLFDESDEVPAYNMNKLEELEQKKLKLLAGKRFHQNARNAYWYYTVKN